MAGESVLTRGPERKRLSLERKVAGLVAALAIGCASGPQVYTTVPPIAPGANDIETTLILIGDAGWALSGDPVLARVTEAAAERPDRTLVVFLGDNVYQNGLAPEGSPDRQRGEGILQAQIAIGRESGAPLQVGLQAVAMPPSPRWRSSW